MTNAEPRNNADLKKKSAPLFIEGWVTDEFAAGRRPVYGYPHSPLPEVSDGDMEIVTGFMAGHR